MIVYPEELMAQRIAVLEAENERLRDKLVYQSERYFSLVDATADRAKELEDELIGIRAAIEDMENPFSGGGAPEMHYGFERAIEDATNLINEALGDKP